jgi:hypothetical protein
MFKLLSALALVSATILPIDAAKAASNWQSYLGDRTCAHLRRGATAYDAGYRAAKDTINSRYGTQFMNAYNRLSEDEFSSILTVQLLSKCPEATLNAS